MMYSWSCNKNKNEDFKGYSKQTIIEAKKYIEMTKNIIIILDTSLYH